MTKLSSIQLTISILASTSAIFAQAVGPDVFYPSRTSISEPLYQLALRASRAPSTKMRDGLPNQPMFKYDGPGYSRFSGRTTNSSVVTKPYVSSSPLTLLSSFEGLGTGYPGYNVTWLGPDTSVAVSRDYVVEFVYNDLAVFDKSGNSLLPSPGFINGSTIWSGQGDGCEVNEIAGDPIIQYDKQADRWLAVETSAINKWEGPYSLCLAVSTTGNPLGTWHRFSYTNNWLGDYEKVGVWPNAYFVGFNAIKFNTDATRSTFLGGAACAFDKAAMLNGATPAMVCFGPRSSPLFYTFPADMDGATPPPPGAAGYFLQQDQMSGLRLYRFQPNFARPRSSTFNDGFGGPTYSYVSLPLSTTFACNNVGGSCIPQPGTTQMLKSLTGFVMQRVAYRSVGGIERLVTNETVDPDAAGPRVAAFRLYEILSPGSPSPVLQTNVTFAPDANERWVASAAQDKLGNIAVGYSISSSTVYPSIGLTGRAATDPPNTLQSEIVATNGTASQIDTYWWGDYSTMQVDPSDDCTFWFANEYMGTTGSFNWKTRIMSLKFPGCN